MTAQGVELALGTVQFGTVYGVAGRGEVVPEGEVREILATAWQRGLRVLDTAPGYGDIESRLDELAGELPFRIVSKIPALPQGVDAEGVGEFVAQSIRRSQQRLGERLDAVLFHDGESLLGEHGTAIWRVASDATGEAGVRLGASFYSPQQALQAHEKFSLQIAQLPGNALDQRLTPAAAASMREVEIHLRSVFLQGLLLLPLERAACRVPAAAPALAAWMKWCTNRGVSPLHAALGAAKSLPGVRYCVVGVDNVAHLRDIINAWREVEPMDLSALSSNELNVIDPRRWTRS